MASDRAADPRFVIEFPSDGAGPCTTSVPCACFDPWSALTGSAKPAGATRADPARAESAAPPPPGRAPTPDEVALDARALRAMHETVLGFVVRHELGLGALDDDGARRACLLKLAGGCESGDAARVQVDALACAAREGGARRERSRNVVRGLEESLDAQALEASLAAVAAGGVTRGGVRVGDLLVLAAAAAGDDDDGVVDDDGDGDGAGAGDGGDGDGDGGGDGGVDGEGAGDGTILRMWRVSPLGKA